MRIAILGAPGSGKTTLGAMLGFLLSPSFVVIHGDAFVTASETHTAELKATLGGSSDWVFEHLEAFNLLSDLGMGVDCLIAITPKDLGELNIRRSQSGRHTIDFDFCRFTELIESQLSRARFMGVEVITGTGIEEILPHLIRYLWKRRSLAQDVNSLVVKVAAGCNLNCSYCYMYQMHDKAWRTVPAQMSVEVALKLGVRIREYLETSRQSSMNIIFHGGEPLLLGASAISKLTESIMAGLGERRRSVNFGIQTNGTLLNDEMLATLDRYGFSVGISMDSAMENGNSERVYHSGKSAYSEILNGIRAAQDYPWKKGNFSGILSVINPHNSGAVTYQEFARLGVNRFDFLLRDETWNNPPSVPAFEFLRGAFEEWLGDTEDRTVRMFSTLVGGLLGNHGGVDSFGLRPISTLCVGTNGTYELLDVLRAAYPSAWSLPYSVLDTSFNDVSESPEFLHTWLDKYAFASECLNCRYLFVCSGGYLPHRYSSTRRFQNPSVHCDSIKRFLGRVEELLVENCDCS